jgi:hypothetical protein
MNESVAHPLLGHLGCRIGHGNGEPSEQARNFLRSLRQATIWQIAGRLGPDLSDDEYRDWLRKLDAWENAGNVVALPPPIMPVGHRYVPRPLSRTSTTSRLPACKT